MRIHAFVLITLSASGLAWTECPPDVQSGPVQGGAAQGPVTAGAAQVEVAPSKSGAIACKVDAECPVLACGPCAPGTVITHELMNGPECARNPCKNAAASCTEQVCVVHAGTEMQRRPDVGPPPPT